MPLARLAILLLVVALVAGACSDDDASVDPAADDLLVLLDELSDDDLDLLLEDLTDAEYDDALDALESGDVDGFLDFVDGDLLDELLGLDPPADESPETSDPGPGDDQPPVADPGGDDLRVLDTGAGDAVHEVTFDVAAGEMSFLAWARSDSTTDEIWVTSVVDPDGRDLLADAGLDDGTFSNFGEVAVLLPLDPRAELAPGRWTVRYESDDDIAASGAILRSGDPAAGARLDVAVWLVTDDDYEPGEIGVTFRSVGDRVFAGSGIAVGGVDVVAAPPDVVDRHGVIPVSDDDPEELPQKALCREMSSRFTGRSVLVAVVDRIADDGEGVIEGNASGLPGTVLVPGSSLSCVIMMGDVDPEFPGRGLAERAIVLWHEVGHHLGLFHTSEATGDAFDILVDTAECSLDFDDGDGFVDAFECPDGTNFMFHDTDETGISADQAAHLRRHPVLTALP